MFNLTKFKGTQDVISIGHIETMATALAGGDPQFLMGVNPGWISSKGAYIYQGNRMHGDSLPSWWVTGLDNYGTNPAITAITAPAADPTTWYNPALVSYWNAINAWGVVWVHQDNTTTNAYTCMYDIQLYILSISTGKWIRIDTSNGKPSFPFIYYELANYAFAGNGSFIFDPVYSRGGWSNVPAGESGLGTAGDRATASATTSKYRISHNAFFPMIEVDGSDVGGIFVTCKARLSTTDGAAFNGVTKIYGQVGSDIKPSLATSLNAGDFAGQDYYIGSGGGNSIELPTNGSSIRISYCTVGGVGFSTNIGNADDSVYGALNPVYLSHAAISANLPVLKFNTPA